MITTYAFNLGITIVSWSQTSYVTALFVNMVFSDEDKILINNLICISWRDIMRDSWSKNFRTRMNEKQHWQVAQEVQRHRHSGHNIRQGSGRRRSVRTDENNDQVNDMVLSQEDQPRTHSTVSEISRGTGIPKSSVVRIIIKAPAAEILKSRRIRAQELTGANCTAGVKCSTFKEVFPVCCSFVYKFLFFSSERIVKIG